MIEPSIYTIYQEKTIRYALDKINNLPDSSCLVLFVVNKTGQLIGSLTDGDIRRGLISGKSLDDTIDQIMKNDFRYLKSLYDYKQFDAYKKEDLKLVPLITDDFHLIEFIPLKKLNAIIPVDAVIMAGGKGVRLKPYTNDTPKPMLELNGKPIIAYNVDRLLSFGIKNIYISVNHLKEQIISYFKKNYSSDNIKFIEEDKPLGTIGSLSLIDKWANRDVLVMNADVLTNIDFLDFYRHYISTNTEMSVATFNVRINIPYGILETTDDLVSSLVEKPSYTYYSNAGIYLLNKNMLRYIPKDKQYDATDLMEKLISENRKISHFPIRGYWLDIGNAQNYAKAQEDIMYIKF